MCALNVEKMYKGKGCKDCDKSGYAGKVPIHSVLHVEGEIQKAIAGGNPARTVIATAQENGFQSLSVQGLQSFLEGKTSFEQIYSFSAWNGAE